MCPTRHSQHTREQHAEYHTRSLMQKASLMPWRKAKSISTQRVYIQEMWHVRNIIQQHPFCRRWNLKSETKCTYPKTTEEKAIIEIHSCSWSWRRTCHTRDGVNMVARFVHIYRTWATGHQNVYWKVWILIIEIHILNLQFWQPIFP